MEIAKIQVTGTRATVVHRRVVPAGLVGGYILVEYTDSLWDTLTKTVVFGGTVTKDVVTDGAIVKIPAETVAKAGSRLYVGFYGTRSDGKLVIPTFWADLGTVVDAADPSGDESTDESLPVWAQLAERVDELEQGSVDPEDIKKAVEDYLTENPVDGTAFTTDETLILDENGVLSVNTADAAEPDNTRPITSAAVYRDLGNIEILLATI